MEKKISVIVPVYKVEDCLDRCIRSIVGQVYKNLEIILVDDESPDKCPQICDDWKKKDTRIKVIHKINGGVSSARNCGLDIASGDYIGFVDSDDWIDENMFDVLINNALTYDADISRVAAFCEKLDGNTVIYSDTEKDIEIFCENVVLRKSICSFNYPNIWQGIYKRELFDNIRFNTDLKVAEDWLLNYEINKLAEKKVMSNKPLYHYIERSSSAMNKNIITGYVDTCKVLNIIWDNEIKDEEIRESLIELYFSKLKNFLIYMVSKGLYKTEEYKIIRESVIKRKRYFFKSKIEIKNKIILVVLWLFHFAFVIKFRRKIL